MCVRFTRAISNTHARAHPHTSTQWNMVRATLKMRTQIFHIVAKMRFIDFALQNVHYRYRSAANTRSSTRKHISFVCMRFNKSAQNSLYGVIGWGHTKNAPFSWFDNFFCCFASWNNVYFGDTRLIWRKSAAYVCYGPTKCPNYTWSISKWFQIAH